MMPSANGARSAAPDLPRLLAYVADLELEVDRLRRHADAVRHEAWASLRQIRLLCSDPASSGGESATLASVADAAGHLAAVVKDFAEVPGYHPAHDQVVAIAVRPLAEQVFRWQQRLLDAADVTLELNLECEYAEWFPARLRHILNGLLSNALQYQDPEKTGSWVRVGLRVRPDAYELRVIDNGVGLGSAQRDRVFDLFFRAAPARAAGLGVGLAVVKMLVEQSGGSLSVDSGAGQGTTFVAILPRFQVDDFLI